MPRILPPLAPRRVRRLRLHAVRLRRRAVFVLGGVVVGAAAYAIAVAADHASESFTSLLHRAPWAAFLVTPAGFALSAFLMLRLFPYSGGSGIPQAIAARHLHGTAARAQLVSLRTALGKIALLILGLLCGASIGREGPTVQVGASVMFAVGRLSPLRQPGLILAGAGAGVAAAFNTPLAGIVFGIEEMGRAFDSRNNGLVIGAVIAAGLTALALQGDYTYFGTTRGVLGPDIAGWIAVPVLGVLGGGLGGLFSRVVIAFAFGLPGRAGAAIKRHPVVFAALCGLAVALCGLLSGQTVFGTGYAQARALVQNEGGVPAAFGLMKLLATTASSISGIPGGIFAPSLAIGAGLGANVAALFSTAPAQVLVVLGMVAYFAGVVQAPITAFVIVAEMTGDHALVIPLMLTALIAYAVSRLVCAEGIYHALAARFIRAAHVPAPAPGS